MKSLYVSLFVLLVAVSCFSQRTLNIYANTWLRTQKLELFEGTEIRYKLKGGFKMRQNKISAFDDSLLYFTDGSVVPLKRLKLINMYNGNHLTDVFQKFFKRLGILFIVLDTTNNVINQRPEVVNKKAVVIAAGLIATGFIVQRIGIKKVRMRSGTFFKITDIKFSELNLPK